MPNVILAGLGFGDEGKGSITDRLCRSEQVRLVCRYNGGAQAAHNVVLPDGRHHTFSQFGSGTFAGVPTLLSRFMLVNPLSLRNEAKKLEDKLGHDPYPLLSVEREALVTNPFQVCTNRLKEVARGDKHHGSCGMGIGETVEDSLAFPDMAIRVRDLQDFDLLVRKLKFSQEHKLVQIDGLADWSSLAPADPATDWVTLMQDPESPEIYGILIHEQAKRWNIVDHTYLPKMLRSGTVLFEGAQGALLDQDYGFYPYTTWSDTTFGNALKLLEGYDEPIKKLGIIRGYMTRHGAGPFPTESKECGIGADVHNSYGQFQKNFRLGHFDLVLLQYALKMVGGVDELVLTNLDQLPEKPSYCTSYKMSPSGGGEDFNITSLPLIP